MAEAEERGGTRLIVGLGNPGRGYERTRHNLGFLAVDRIAEDLRAGRWREEEFVATTHATPSDATGRVWFAKPLTFMNLSGPPVAGLARYYKIDPAHLLVVLDDVAIPFGRLRLRESGSSGGHKGLESVIAALGTQNFPRLRIGIGPLPPHRDLADFVLRKLSKSEAEMLDSVLDRIVEGVWIWRTRGPAAAANFANAPLPETSAEDSKKTE